MAEVAVGPPAPEARGLDDGGAPFQRFLAVVRNATWPMPATLEAVSLSVWCS
jgi:hypothetical protein